MTTIRHRVGAVAPLADVHAALTTIPGLSAWWTTDTAGDPAPGGTIAFRFGDVGGFDMEVLEIAPDTVRWRVSDGPEEWIDTQVGFALSRSGDHTIVLFTHEDWREVNEFHSHCSTKWAAFLLSLKEYVETGTGRPHPDDVSISDWH
ncbi:SRPBCC domain-containing protein [Nocardioides anomalus]|uniref:SRPBCC domain-containing protein n=1 Tax=Nocardioides anomalus TaxID=2712223 RepID=A0A6G6W893_9ACTN|nr:SRPBCC domain-containing protein [Nocardioides anomalus]QIG41444.1 SRPBCC domain-containing protein [Nocardioides anomalus]